MSRCGLTVEMAHSLDAVVRLVVEGHDGVPAASLDGIAGTLQGGTKQSRFGGVLPRSPLGVRLTVELPGADDPPPPFDVWVDFSPGAWYGQPVLHLAFFDQLRALFSAAVDGSLLRLECRASGNLLFTGTATLNMPKFLEPLKAFLETLHRARVLASELGVNPPLPADFGRKDADEIDELTWYSGKGDVPRRFRELVVTTELRRHDAARLANGLREESVANLRLPFSADGKTLLRQNVDLGQLTLSVGSAQLATTPAEIRRRLRGAKSDFVTVRWRTTPHSKSAVAREYLTSNTVS